MPVRTFGSPEPSLHGAPVSHRSAHSQRLGSGAIAAIAAIRDVWARYLEVQGLREADCPIEGLFVQSASSSSGAVASSSD